jgi:tetratricopeptide (TPR) repeat protein
MRPNDWSCQQNTFAVRSALRGAALLSAWTVLILCSCLHREAAAQNAEMDIGDGIEFEIRPWTVVVDKEGVRRVGRELAPPDAKTIRIRITRPEVVVDIPRENVVKYEPALTPPNAVDEQFKKNPERTAGVARKAMRVFIGNKDVEKVVNGQLELAAGRGDTAAMGLLVEVKLTQGEWVSAEQLARQLIARKNFGMAQALLMRALAGEGKRPEADAALEQALKMAPDDPMVMVWTAEYLLDTGRSEKAREIFASALTRNPKNTSALVGAGYVALRQGMLDEAADCFGRARAAIPSTELRDPRFVRATLGLAATKALQGQYEDTKQLSKDVLNIDTSNARAYGLQGYAFLMAGGENESQALPKIDIALKGEPENPRFKAIKAIALMRQGQLSQANEKPDDATAKLGESAKLLAEIAEADLNDPWAAYLVAEMLFDQQQYDRALPQFQKAALLNANYAPAHQAVGATALALKKWPEAEAAYRKAIELDDKVAEYQAGLGLALLGQRQNDKAQEVLKQAWQMDRSNVEALCGLGYLANLDKNEVTMKDLFHQALACDGDCAYAADALKKLYAFRNYHMEYLTFTEDPPPGWSVARGAGRLRPEKQNGVLQWRGPQSTGVTPRVDYCTTGKAEEFVRLEADLCIKPDSPTVMGLRIGSAGGNIAFFFEFGKDENNRMAYRLQDFRGMRDWTQLGEWPKSGKVRLGVESPDLLSGQIQLYVNGERKLAGKLELARTGRITAGVFLQAGANTAVDAYADNIVYVCRRAQQVVNEDVPTELKPVEQPAPNGQKTPDGKPATDTQKAPDTKATPDTQKAPDGKAEAEPKKATDEKKAPGEKNGTAKTQ